jgi:hypothetical protein
VDQELLTRNEYLAAENRILKAQLKGRLKLSDAERATLAKAGQSGGFSLSNIGINFGGRNTQTNKVGNVTPEGAKGGKTDWVGLGIAAIGLVTAVIGLFKG